MDDEILDNAGTRYRDEANSRAKRSKALRNTAALREPPVTHRPSKKPRALGIACPDTRRPLFEIGIVPLLKQMPPRYPASPAVNPTAAAPG